ncbi:MAG: tetratricopeptide repeat protein [Saprospiraceae bacterium]|nr:tetratricopeptide repeat protein [Saprospiraceae bacterium]
MAKRPTQKPGAAAQANVPAESRPFSWQWPLLAVVLIITAVVYWPSLQNGFTNFDDDVYVTNNPHINNPPILATKEVAGNFHPLTMWSLSMDNEELPNKKGPDPKPFHRTSLLLHLLNVALTFGLVRALRGSVWVAAFVALIFAIHPMHVESVAWVSSRKDVLFSAFFLGGLWLYAHQRNKGELATGDWAKVLILFLLSLLSKPAAIVFPAIVLLTDWYLQPQGRRQWVMYGIMGAMSAVFSLVTMKYQQHVGAVVEEDYFSFGQRAMFAAYGLMVYLGKLVFPFNLSAFHPAPDRTVAFGSAFYAAIAGALGLLAVTAWAWKKGWRNWFYGLAFYVIMLSLVLGFIKVGSALYAERYTYLAYTGLLLAIGLWGERFVEKGAAQKLGLLAAAGLFAAFFIQKTREQISVWRDGETLWTQVIQQYPQERNYLYRGYYRFQREQWAAAMEDFDKAYELNPNNETSVHIRALCFQKLGKKDEAITAFNEYESKFPPKAEVLIAAGNLYQSLNRHADAVPRFEKAKELMPESIDVYNNLAIGYFNLQKLPEAEQMFTKALSINPNFIHALNNRGACRLTMGKYAEAIEDLSKSLTLNPNQPQMRDYRARCYDALGKKAEAAADRAAMGK